MAAIHAIISLVKLAYGVVVAAEEMRGVECVVMCRASLALQVFSTCNSNNSHGKQQTGDYQKEF